MYTTRSHLVGKTFRWGGTTRNPHDDPAHTYKGPPSGPAAHTLAASLEPASLAVIFIEFLHLADLKKIAEASIEYATQQPVKKSLTNKMYFNDGSLATAVIKMPQFDPQTSRA